MSEKGNLPRWGRPHAPVKAVSSILNFGSPRPPEETDPEGLVTCWRVPSADTNASMRLRVEVSAPDVYWSMMALKTSEESRVHV